MQQYQHKRKNSSLKMKVVKDELEPEEWLTEFDYCKKYIEKYLMNFDEIKEIEPSELIE